VEPALSEGLVEEFWRSWAVPGADGTWGGPEDCGLGVPVTEADLRREAHGTAGSLVPTERLEHCGVGPALAPLEAAYEPFLSFGELPYSWGRFEAEEQLEARMREFFDFVCRHHRGQTVLLVSHAGPVFALLRSVVPAARASLCGYCGLHVLCRQGSQGDWTAPVVPRPLVDADSRRPGAAMKARMAKELFVRFDEDGDGFWSLLEASRLLVATLGAKLPAQMFISLLAAIAVSEGETLMEEDVTRGLSQKQVVSLYTDPELQQVFGAVLDVRRDYAAVFQHHGATA